MATCFEILWKKSKVISSWVLDTFLFRFWTKFEFNWLESFAAPKITSKSFENVSSLPTVGKNERSLKNNRTQNCPTTSVNPWMPGAIFTYLHRKVRNKTDIEYIEPRNVYWDSRHLPSLEFRPRNIRQIPEASEKAAILLSWDLKVRSVANYLRKFQDW